MFTRRLVPFSFRQRKCLVISLLVVCGLTSITVFHFHEKSLVNQVSFSSSENKRKALALHHEKTESITFDEENATSQKQTIQFVPQSDLPPLQTEVKLTQPERPLLQSEVEVMKNKRKELLTANNQKQPGGVNQQFQQVPVYIPEGYSSMKRGDIPATQLLIDKPYLRGRLLPGNVYPSQEFFHQINGTVKKDQEVFVPQRRLVHLDLKGAPPKIQYLEQIVPILVQLGATGLVVEYEDMFPFEGILKNIAAKNHYTKSEVRSLLSLAQANNLEVIPLVQTFGHLEFALKLEQFSHLRENPDVAQAICPSRNDSFTLIEHLIDQVMSLHDDVRYLHIGCDEVFHIAECPLCSVKPKDDLFLGHVHRVAKYVRDKYKVIPVIWDDMLRHMTVDKLLASGLGPLVEPMIWVYAEDVYRFAGSYVFERYAQVFPSFWAASAFKGAFGETLVVPNVKRHLENNLNWLEVARTEGPKFREGFRGIVLTAWQRYDHFAVLCELLPATIPSLSVTLLTTSKGYYNQSLAPTLFNALTCTKSPKYEKMPEVEYDPFLHDKMTWCSFPGSSFFKLTGRFLQVEKEVENYVKTTTQRKGWLTEFSVRHNFSSPARIDELVRDVVYLAGSVNNLAKQTIEALKDIYDVHTISEWMEQKLLPLFEQLDRIQLDAQKLKVRKNWPTRPLPLFKHWEYYGVRLDMLTNNTLDDSSTSATATS